MLGKNLTEQVGCDLQYSDLWIPSQVLYQCATLTNVTAAKLQVQFSTYPYFSPNFNDSLIYTPQSNSNFQIQQNLL
jgi:hypothetical protein